MQYMDKALDYKKEIKLAQVSLAVTMLVLVAMFATLGGSIFSALLEGDTTMALEGALLGMAMFFASYGNVLYHVCLIGNYKRRAAHVVPPADVLERVYERSDAPKISVIIPAYKEERSTNWQTMMSAALSEYPTKNVVLLIDDPYKPTALADMVKLDDTRLIPGEMQALFDAPRAEMLAAQERFNNRPFNAANELANLSELFDGFAQWIDGIAANYMGKQAFDAMPFADRFFVENILMAPSAKHKAFAAALRERLAQADLPDHAYIARQYARLVGFYTVNFSSFERKKYANLCHEANKAMNLNSYIALVGRSWREVEQENGDLHLVQCSADEATFSIPAADYINTIDSDSLMLGEYSLRLVEIFERPENSRLAVIQSPVSSFQGAPVGLERTAGACIDIQFRTHQGYTYWGASFWVGANAMLRHVALEDIRETRIENGHEIAIYIQDRTVIEDTESTIDLVHKGWKLDNYVERMTFSANPPDFGSLLIQRRRWSNGGLIILPKLIRYVMNSKKNVALAKELFMRFHYLASTTTGCMAAMIFIFYPFPGTLASFWMPLSVIPFFILFMRDLKNTSYTIGDGLRICAMNLMLFPIVTGGVLKMFQQIITGKKIPFGRTPKITGRTAAPALYSFIAVAMPVAFLASAAHQLAIGSGSQAIFAVINSAFMTYALVHFVGIKAAFEDMFAGVHSRFRTRFYKAEVYQLHAPTPSPTPAPQLAAVRN